MFWFTAAVLLCALFLASEWFARRLIRRGRPYVFLPSRRLRLHLDRETHPQLEPVLRHIVNELGERGRPIPRKGRVFRVLVVGGSAAECFLLDQDTQWPSVLEARLCRPGALAALRADDVHVGNIGRSGVDSGSLDQVLADVLPLYPRLDLIVVMVGASDVLRWLSAGAPPDRPAKRMTSSELYAWGPRMKLGWAPSRWGLTAWVRRLRDRRWDDQRNAVRWMGRARRNRANALQMLNDTPDDRVVLTAFRTQFSAVLRRCQAHADRVFVLRQAWFEKPSFSPEEEALFWGGGVGYAYTETVTTFYSTRVIFELMQRVDALAGELAGQDGVEQLRLQDLLSPSTDNFIDLWHQTPAGSTLIGDLVAAAVLRGTGTAPGDASPPSLRPSRAP